jgi:serine phosphatase RsbU (regulator of sigma subunit)
VRLTLSNIFQHFTGTRVYFSIGGWHWQYTLSTLTLLGIVTLVIFARDLIRDRREKQRMAAELEAGRAVQQVLIPEEIPTIPGFNIHSVYKPYGEVGGDFFQILPIKTGGVLVVIGDVSGKGMPAAMMVSLLVGTALTLAESTTSPSEILTGLNHRLQGRSRGGFTTCLVLRADSSGTLIIANAGHIAPYLGGKELTLNNGFPLGLSAQSTYTEGIFQLAAGQQLTLVTDGVVEARDKTGALFGFDRTAAMSSQSADQIAKTAELFGQDDDITVPTLERTVSA